MTNTTATRAHEPISRRSLVAAMAAVPAAAATGAPLAAAALDAGPPAGAHPDAALIALGSQLDGLGPLLDAACARLGEAEYRPGAPVAPELAHLWDQHDETVAAIAATPAQTLRGLFVKARAAASIDGLEPADTDDLMMHVLLSVARDLLRMR